MSDEDSQKTFAQLSECIEIGGRVAYWNLFNTRCPPDSCKLILQKEAEELHKIDRVFFYSEFCVAARE